MVAINERQYQDRHCLQPGRAMRKTQCKFLHKEKFLQVMPCDGDVFSSFQVYNSSYIILYLSNNDRRQSYLFAIELGDRKHVLVSFLNQKGL